MRYISAMAYAALKEFEDFLVEPPAPIKVDPAIADILDKMKKNTDHHVREAIRRRTHLLALRIAFEKSLELDLKYCGEAGLRQMFEDYSALKALAEHHIAVDQTLRAGADRTIEEVSGRLRRERGRFFRRQAERLTKLMDESLRDKREMLAFVSGVVARLGARLAQFADDSDMDDVMDDVIRRYPVVSAYLAR